MSRITIHLKEEFHSPKSARANHRYDEGAMDVSFTRDHERSPSDATEHTRCRSYSSSSGHANLGLAFARPQPAHFLSTIFSESLGTRTPARDASPVATWLDISTAKSARVGEPEEDVEYIQTVRRLDNESAYLPTLRY
jgi:hypothetical protein